MQDKDTVLAKPSGITLSEHKCDVVAESVELCRNLPASLEYYSKLTGKDMVKRLRVVASLHDEGKCLSIRWQDACRKDYCKFVQWKKENAEGSFNDYCHDNPSEAGRNLRKVGVRHEMYSLKPALDKRLPIPLLVAIAAHHSKLGYGFEDKWNANDLFAKCWERFVQTSNMVIEAGSFQSVCDKNYEYGAVRGLLQLADHRASAREEREYVADINSFSYKFPFAQKRGIQKLIEANCDKDILLLRAPTGAGKTDASLLWASHQISTHKADRLVIAMPTRFTANALAVNVTESLSSTGLYHSSAWYSEEKTIDDGEVTRQKALAQHKMARLLATPVTVCTIDHLLMALTQTREDHHLIDFNLANSCVVIDEADFYDEFTLANILFLLEVLRCWNVPVLIMSASLPESSLALYRRIGYDVNEILEDKDNPDNERCRFEICEIAEYEVIDELGYLVDACFERGNGIIYMNTVDKAIAVYKKVKEMIDNIGIDIPVVLYHSRFTESDKLLKEQRLLDMLGRKAWEKGTAKGIAILTQIGEISINISSEIMISDMCPIDRLMQRAGRLCRFDNAVGKMYIVVPYKEGELYPAPYGAFSQKDKIWVPCKAFMDTAKVLKKGKYSSESLVKLLNEVYSEEPQIGIKACDNANMLRQMFICNWLICPMEKWQEDDTRANNWSSRDITPQGFAFVSKPTSTYFRNYSEYMEFQLAKSISMPAYLLEKGRKLHKIGLCKITIGSKVPVAINVIREGFYSFDIGFDLSEVKEDNFL